VANRSTVHMLEDDPHPPLGWSWWVTRLEAHHHLALYTFG
jgi:hypothetical protein